MNMSGGGDADMDVPVDLRYSSDNEILQASADTTTSMNYDVLNFLPVQTQPEYDEDISSTVNTGKEAELPVFGPASEYESPPSFDDGDIQGAGSIPGVCGLRNLGNTCYMNAGLQCLFNNKIFINFFVENNVEIYEGNTLTNQFSEIIKKVWTGQYSVLNLSSFKEAYGAIHSQFQNYRQHDCQEFLALLLDTMHEQILSLSCSNVIKTNSPHHSSPKGHAEVHKNFKYGLLKSETVSSNTCVYSDSKVSDEESSLPGSPINELTSSFEKNTETAPILKSLLHAENTHTKKARANLPDCDSHVTKKHERKRIINLSNDNTVLSDKVEKITNMLKDSNSFDNIVNKDEFESDNALLCEELYKYKLCSAEKSPPKATNKLEKNQIACKINAARKVPSIEDFVKDTKTLNTNVLVTDEANNLLKFDSEKFPKFDHNRLQETVNNLSSMPDFYLKQSTLKRVKVTNLIHDTTESNSSDATMSAFVSKRLKIDDHSEHKYSDGNASDQEDTMDMDQSIDEFSEESSQSSELNVPTNENSQASLVEEILKANADWEKYQAGKYSIIMNNFHGQFKSSVVCSQCSHVSIFYEPFMYLPVPLPHALERQIVVTYVQNKAVSPVRYLVNVQKYDKVQTIKDNLLTYLEVKPQEVILAEVFENHISRYLDDNILVQHVNDIGRLVYAFAVDVSIKHLNAVDSSKHTENTDENVCENSVNSTELWDDPFPCVSEKSSSLDLKPDNSSFMNTYFSEKSSEISSTTIDAEKKSEEESPADKSPIQDENITQSTQSQCSIVQWNSCVICLEEMADYQLLQHPSCLCILCKNCIKSLSFYNPSPSIVAYSGIPNFDTIRLDNSISCKINNASCNSGAFICPVCNTPVSPTKDFVPVNKLDNSKCHISLISIPIVIRHDFIENETSKCRNLVGHPGLLKLPTCLSATELYECVDSYIPFLSTYSLLLVNGQGNNCSRCLYTQHCSGCEVARVGDIRLKPGDSLAVRYFDLSKENIEQMSYVSDHRSMQQKRHKNSLSLYDCIEAFSESENLDENSPWFCPVCCRNQQAVKSLSVWRWPEVLIICLKRFVFHEYTSMKLDDKVVFPLEGLNLKSYTTGPSEQALIYDLQACVCHFGSVNSGHYTAYSKHAVTSDWYYYSDETATKQVPNTEECVNEYILFYQRR